jgi:putative endonuclease
VSKTAKAGLSTRQIGQDGEALAAKALQERGFCIIARNLRSRKGEVDLIALDGEALVFIEVKNWPAYGIEDLALAVNKKKQNRIIETAKYFIDTHREYCYNPVRFDIVYLRPGEPVVHLVSAFTES